MFRQIAAIFLLLAFTAQVFNRAFIVLDYYTNTAFFAKNCENKARPTMHCNGKCQMMKKLKEEEKKDQQNPGSKTNKSDVISSRSFFAKLSYQNSDNFPSFSSFYCIPFSKGTSHDIFHPPALV